MTSIAIAIPTTGRDTLTRCLESCVYAGLEAGDLVAVIADTREWDQDSAIESLLAALRPIATTCAVVALTHNAGHICWGHCQLNIGLDYIQLVQPRDYVMCQDDDDIYVTGAITRIREALDERAANAPMLARFQSWWGAVYWDTHGVATEGHIGGHCAVFPNDERLGRFTCRYQGDYDYIRATLDNWGGESQATWLDEVIAVARPQVVQRERVTA